KHHRPDPAVFVLQGEIHVAADMMVKIGDFPSDPDGKEALVLLQYRAQIPHQLGDRQRLAFEMHPFRPPGSSTLADSSRPLRRPTPAHSPTPRPAVTTRIAPAIAPTPPGPSALDDASERTRAEPTPPRRRPSAVWLIPSSRTITICFRGTVPITRSFHTATTR